MNNKNFIICGRMYLIDVDVCDFATSIMVVQAQRSQDEEYQKRVMQSVVLRAIGLETLISISAGDVAETFEKVIRILLGGNHASSD